MPWKECLVMDERMRFISRLLDGEKMAEVCRGFGISRKTGYKIWYRYRDTGVRGLTDRSRRPVRYAHQLPMQVEKCILRIKREKPSWGAPKIRERIARKYPDIAMPAKSTIHAVLDRHGLVKRRRRRRFRAQGTRLSPGLMPNDLWCADYKGQFKVGSGQYCYPLTISDFKSRYLLSCESLENTQESYAFSVFEKTFQAYGLPSAIRTDNGLPFASPSSLFGLSQLSVWWLRLGITLERIQPGHPEQNGRHERMHLTLKKETTQPPAQTVLAQQMKFDDFIEEYNTDRPHQALEMRYPAEVYAPSPRPYKGLPDVEYPFHDLTLTVTTCGRLCLKGKKINLSRALAGQTVGIREASDGIWLVSFMDYDLGYFDEENRKLEPLENPFGPKIIAGERAEPLAELKRVSQLEETGLEHKT